jgi:hypothetical protein
MESDLCYSGSERARGVHREDLVQGAQRRDGRERGYAAFSFALQRRSLRHSNAGKRQWSEQLASGVVRTEADWRLLPLEGPD